MTATCLVLASSLSSLLLGASPAWAIPQGQPIGTSYCAPAVPNSTGSPAAISASGSQVVVDNDVTLHAAALPPNQFGYFLASPTQGFIANPGGSAGNFCLGGGALLGRYSDDVLNSGAAGSFDFVIDLTQVPIGANPGTVAIQPGDTWNFQCWYRDAPTNNFTDGLNIEFLAAGPPPVASGPSPADGATAVSSTVLAWDPAPGATSYDVYLGTGAAPGPGDLRGSVATPSFDAGSLLLDTAYTWRIDTVNSAGATTGDVWAFTTLPAPSATEVIFFDGFESGGFGAGGWTPSSGDARVSTSADYTGTWGAEMRRSSSITRALDTTGRSGLHLSYVRRCTSNYESGDEYHVEWYDGATWNVLETSQSSSWSPRDFDLPAGASGNPAFAFRFRNDASSSNERLYVDDVELATQITVQAVDPALDFGSVEQGSALGLPLLLTNAGSVEQHVTSLTFVVGAGSSGPGADFHAEVGGTEYHGGQSTVLHTIDLLLPADSVTPLWLFFAPSEHGDYALDLELAGTFSGVIDAQLSGLGGADPDWGFLHPVIDSQPDLVVDYDEDGQELVHLFGNESHTHEPGRAIVTWEWRDGPTLLSTAVDPDVLLPIGQATLTLTIYDDAGASASDDATLDVFAPDSVPGVLASYYQDTLNGPLALLDAVPAQADFVESLPALDVQNSGGQVGGSPFANDVMVRVQAILELGAPGALHLVPFGGVDQRVFLDGAAHTGPVAVEVGSHTLEVRFAVQDLGDLPLGLDAFLDGAPITGFGAGLVHDRRGVAPVVHSMPTAGVPVGGNQITIAGFGFYPADAVVVHWGAAQDFSLALGNLTWISGEELRLLSPPGSGGSVVAVTVETPGGTSAPRNFTYSSSGPVPVAWLDVADVGLTASPTTAEWGPDGRLWVGTREGRLFALEFDDNYSLLGQDEYVGIDAGATADDAILGLTFDPYDDPAGPVRVLVSHGELFAQGGSCFSGNSPFPGAVSALTGPSFDAPVTVVDGLPVSNHDHGVNGIFVDDNGDLFISVGGNTNAGIPACPSGDLPESPLTGALLKASTSRPDFNGNIQYEHSTTGQVMDDQVFGDALDLVAGIHVQVWASGLRNPYDAVLTTRGRVYATDNGPNNTFGAASLSCGTQGADPQDYDELNLVRRGNYYGHPNRNRGRFDPEQCVYRDLDEPALPGAFTQALSQLDSSTNGIVEYRATAFGEALRGRLIVQKWNSRPRVVELTADGRNVVAIRDDLILDAQLKGLDVTTAPGGVLVAANYSSDRIELLVPDDVGASGLTPYDITPWRAPSVGGQRFEIGGSGFGTLANTSVTIGGLAAPLTSVSPRRIVGTVPSRPGGATGLVDVIVTVGGSGAALTQAFRFLPPMPGLDSGLWGSGTDMPAALGEVACGVVGGELFVVGEGSSTTYVYDVEADTWSSSPAPRPFAGNHHAAEVVDDMLYLFGGLSSGAGRVQIFDPAAGVWSIGADMPWNGGSCSSAAIGGLVYVCGGIVGSSTVGNLSVYDPVADVWDAGGALPAMPTPVNHAAATTDGSRLFVFGGRQGGNSPQTGFDTVQVFDPATGQWDSSDLPGSTLTPLPAGRGGTGRAVSYFGELYVMGGEDSSNVYSEVFAYDPVLNTWRLDASLLTARHGIFPVRYEDRILVAGGGTNPGFSSSTVVEVFRRR